MPRRQAGNKDHPQFPRAIRPDISVLLRDGQPLHKEIEGEPNPRKRRERERARDFAHDCLFKMYRYAERRGKLEDLDIRVRFFCEESRERNAGILPRPTGGRPTLEHRRLSLAVHVIEEIEALGRKRGSIELALKTVAKRDNVSYDHVRDIHYDPDPGWRRVVAAELARRKFENESKG
jgi:hypothetical protein